MYVLVFCLCVVLFTYCVYTHIWVLYMKISIYTCLCSFIYELLFKQVDGIRLGATLLGHSVSDERALAYSVLCSVRAHKNSRACVDPGC